LTEPDLADPISQNSPIKSCLKFGLAFADSLALTLALTKENVMKVLVAYDGSECANRALEDVQRAGLPEKTQVCVLAVVEHWLPPPSSLEIVEHLDYNQEFLALARLGAMSLQEAQPNWDVHSETRAGSPARAILDKAEAWDANLIVVGSHGRGALGRLFFGSVSQKVLHHAKGTVRIARGRTEPSAAPLRLLIGVDGSANSAAAVKALLQRQLPPETEVRVVTALWTLPPVATSQTVGPVTAWVLNENARVRTAVETVVEQFRAAGLKTEAILKDDTPQKLLLEEAEGWDADCIFVGAHGMNVLERFLIGSVSSTVAARAHCSVEVVR
jgi:nucleotide-binding universal stress UspA family protein